jgi:hypothetical protein
MNQDKLPEFPDMFKSSRQDEMYFFLGLMTFVSLVFLFYYYLAPLMQGNLSGVHVSLPGGIEFRSFN